MVGAKSKGREDHTNVNTEADLDTLFKAALTEFTAARNALATRLKKTGDSDEAARVKSLSKPSISAWAVNQLYWHHREAFDELIAAGQRFGRAQATQLSGKSVDMREPLAARREALSNLLRLADGLLRQAGHSPTPDTIRRLTTTLEALSVYSLLAGGPSAGRLTEDVDPPGFEALAALIPTLSRDEQAGTVKPTVPSTALPPPDDSGKQTDRRQANITAAKAALAAAEGALKEARTTSRDLEEAIKKATALADAADSSRREAQERFEKAGLAAEEARQRLQALAADAEKAAKESADAESSVEKARRELEELTDG
jgi:hypothetical protein